MKLWTATVVALAVVSGCSVAHHRAYQVTIASVAAASFAHSVLQTRVALDQDPAAMETNPLLGADPGPLRLGAALGFNLCLTAGTLALPRDRVPEWYVDLTMTALAMFAVSMAYNDTAITDARWYR